MHHLLSNYNYIITQANLRTGMMSSVTVLALLTNVHQMLLSTGL